MAALESRRAVVAVVLLIAGCGDDGGAGQPQSQPARPGLAATPGAVAGGPDATKNKLVERPHIEDRVACPIPDQPSDPKGGRCDPKAPSCGEHLYCLTLAKGDFCEPCPERDGIRRAFRERDFDSEHNRDPFQTAASTGRTPGRIDDLTKNCRREDQLIATSYSYGDLKLVGIVAQGTLRKALMMGGALGYFVKRGDCIGKEKAFVKDIGTGYVTLQLTASEISVQLNPKQLAITEPELPVAAPRTTIAPAASQGAPAAGSGSAAPAPAGTPPAAGSAAAPTTSPARPAEAPPAGAKKP